jgi:hypothetical protein
LKKKKKKKKNKKQKQKTETKTKIQMGYPSEDYSFRTNLESFPIKDVHNCLERGMRALLTSRRIVPLYFLDQKIYLTRSIFNKDEAILGGVADYCIPENLGTCILVPKPAPVP